MIGQVRRYVGIKLALPTRVHYANSYDIKEKTDCLKYIVPFGTTPNEII